MVSHGFTWFHIVHISKTLPRRAIQASACRRSRKRTTHAPKESTEQFWKMKTRQARHKKCWEEIKHLASKDWTCRLSREPAKQVVTNCIGTCTQSIRKNIQRHVCQMFAIWIFLYLKSVFLDFLWYSCDVVILVSGPMHELEKHPKTSGALASVFRPITNPFDAVTQGVAKLHLQEDILRSRHPIYITGRHWTSLALAHDVTVDVRSSSVCGPLPFFASPSGPRISSWESKSDKHLYYAETIDNLEVSEPTWTYLELSGKYEKTPFSSLFPSFLIVFILFSQNFKSFLAFEHLWTSLNWPGLGPRQGALKDAALLV